RGMPLGGMIARDVVMDWPSSSHASTFAGNPVSCRAALATLDLLEQGYIANAAERGEQLRQGLRKLQRRRAEIGDIRGLGLMVAVDILSTSDPRMPDPAARDEIVQTAFRHGLLLLGCGETAVRFCPPLCVTAEQVETALALLGGALAARHKAAVAV